MKSLHIALATVIPPDVPYGIATIYYNGAGEDMTAEIYDRFPEDLEYRTEVLEYSPESIEEALEVIWAWYSGYEWQLNFLKGE